MTFNIASMLNPAVYDHPVKSIKLIETHISWVVLTGSFAYKIKKPVNFGFLDFSTLEKRRLCCEQELHLNRRLADAIYLNVVSITGTADKPVISKKGDAFEYAVKMAEFPQSAQLDNMLAVGELNAEHMDAIAHRVAAFHQVVPVANDAMDYGSKDSVYQPVIENFIQINQHFKKKLFVGILDKLESWSHAEFKKLESVFEQRKHNEFIRECHGDLHLRNLVWLDGKPLAFDCIEFNAALRWIDVISDIAFLVMDLQARQQPHLANRFLNTYLEIMGDYAGLSVLKFYLCYRAMVRAKVDALRLEQENISADETEHSFAEFKSYLGLATGYIQPAKPKLIIMRGASASGKSTVSQQLLDATGAIRIRSDVERKRLFNKLEADASTEINTGIYSAQASQQTYAKLLELAEEIILSGYTVIVDAAFLDAAQRIPFCALAGRLVVPYIILEVTAPVEVLRQRIVKRKQGVSDADLSVLEHQLANSQPLHKDELSSTVFVNTAEFLDINKLLNDIKSLK